MMNDGENDCKRVMNASYSETSHLCCKGIQTNSAASTHQDVSFDIATSASNQISQDRVSSSSNYYSLSSCHHDSLPQMTGSSFQEKQFLKNASSPSPSLSSSPTQNSSFSSPSITVPQRWKRVLHENKIVYISPSNCHLSSIQEVISYLQTDGTCKCGLNCPLVVTSVFNFDPALPSDYPSATLGQCLTTSSVHCCFSKPPSSPTVRSAPSPKDKKPIVLPPPPLSKSPSPKKENNLTLKRKRLKLKNRSPFDGVLVSQLLAQRDKFGLKKKEEQLNNMASEIPPDSKIPLFHNPLTQQVPLQSQAHLMDPQQPVMVSYLEPLPSTQEINMVPRYQQLAANPSEIKAFQTSDGSYGLYTSNLKAQSQIPILSHPIIQNVNIITGNTSYNCVAANQPFSNTPTAPPSLFTQQVQINPNCLSDSQLTAENLKIQQNGGKLAFITSKDLQCHNVDMRNLPADNNIAFMNPNNFISPSTINYAIPSGAQVPLQTNCNSSVPHSASPSSSNSLNSLSCSNQSMPCNRLVVDPNVVNVVIGKPHEKQSHFSSLKGQGESCSTPKNFAFESMQGASLPLSNVHNFSNHASSAYQNIVNSSSPNIISYEAPSSSSQKHEPSPIIIPNQATSNSLTLSPSNNIYTTFSPQTSSDVQLQNNLNPLFLSDKSKDSPLTQPIKISLSNHTLHSCTKSPTQNSSSISTPPANALTSLEANSLCNLQHSTLVMVGDSYNSKQAASSTNTKGQSQQHLMEPHAILAQNQVPSQGMITMLQAEPSSQMAVSEEMKPAALNTTPQVLSNGSCFIMGSTPSSFVAKPQPSLIQESMVSSQDLANASSFEALVASKSLEIQRPQGDNIIFIERNRVAENSLASQIILNKICQAEKDGKIIVPEPLLNQMKEIESGSQTSNSLAAIKNNTSVPSLFSLPPTSVVSTCSFVNDSNKKIHCQVVNNPPAGMLSIGSKQHCAMNSPMPPISIPMVTSVTTSMAQVIPAVGIAPSMLSQSVQPVVQVINTIPLNAMQNTLLFSGGQQANLQQNTTSLDPSNLLGAPNVINNVILPSTSLSFVPGSQTTTFTGINCHQAHLVPTIDEKLMECRPENFEGACSTSTSGTPTMTLPSSSTQVPFSLESHMNLPINNNSCGTFVGTSKKRSRDSKRKMNQTVASILQLSNQVSPVVVQGIQQPQQIINQPMLQTVTVLPSLQDSQPRPLFQQQIVNYGNNLTTPLGANTTQFLGTSPGMAASLGVMQPLNMINMSQSGTTIFQNFPFQHMMPGSSVTLIHESQGLNQLAPQEQHPVMINNAASAPFTLQAAQMPNAFNNGSLVPNFMATNPLYNSPMVKTEIISNPSLSLVPNQNHLAPRPPAHSNLGTPGHIMQPIISLPQESWHIPKIENVMSYAQTPITQVKEISQKDLSISPSEGRTNVFEARSIGVQSIDCEDQVVFQNAESNLKPSSIGKVTSSLVVSSTQQQPDSQSYCSPSEGEYLWPDPGNLSAAVRAVIHSDKIYKDNPPPSCLEKYSRGYISNSNNLLVEKPSSVEKPLNASSSGTICQGSIESYGLCDTTTSEIWPQQQVMKCDTTVGEPSDSPDPALEPMDLVHSSNGASVVRTERKKGYKRHRWDTLINDESLVQEEVRS